MKSQLRLLAPLSLAGLLALASQTHAMTCADVFAQTQHAVTLKQPDIVYIGIGEYKIRMPRTRIAKAHEEGRELGHRILTELMNGGLLKQDALASALRQLQENNETLAYFIQDNPVLVRESNNRMSSAPLIPEDASKSTAGTAKKVVKKGIELARGQKFANDATQFSNSLDQLITNLQKLDAVIQSPAARGIKSFAGKIPVVRRFVSDQTKEASTLKGKIEDIDAAIVTGALSLQENSEFILDMQLKLQDFEEQQVSDFEKAQAAIAYLIEQKDIMSNDPNKDTELIRQIERGGLLRLTRFNDGKIALIATLALAKNTFEKTVDSNQFLIEDANGLRNTVPPALTVALSAKIMSEDAEKAAGRHDAARDLLMRSLKATVAQTERTDKAILRTLGTSTINPQELGTLIANMKIGKANFDSKVSELYKNLQQANEQTMAILKSTEVPVVENTAQPKLK